MSRRFAVRTLGAFGALVLASCFGDAAGPGERRTGQFAIAPAFDVHALRLADVNRVRIRLVRPGGTTALDTVVDFPAGADLQRNLRGTDGAVVLRDAGHRRPRPPAVA